MTPELQSFGGTRGVVYVCFGDEYCRVGVVSAQSASQKTGLPIHVITNCKNCSQLEWPDGTTFAFLDKPDEYNRAVRTRLDEYTPFDRTLHVDADIWFADSDTALPLAWLDYWDMVIVTYRTLRRECFKNPQWGDITERLGTADHSAICGGVLYFKKNNAVHEMHRWWHRYWKQAGKGRDMPHLFRALWRSQVRFWPLPGENVWIGVAKGHFRHAAGGQRVPELPQIVKYKPNGLDENGQMVIWTRVAPPGVQVEKRSQSSRG